MVIDLHTILAMSSDVECTFSAAKSTIEEACWRLLPNMTEALQCFVFWFRGGYCTREGLHEVFKGREAAERAELEESEGVLESE